MQAAVGVPLESSPSNANTCSIERPLTHTRLLLQPGRETGRAVTARPGGALAAAQKAPGRTQATCRRGVAGALRAVRARSIAPVCATSDRAAGTSPGALRPYALMNARTSSLHSAP